MVWNTMDTLWAQLHSVCCFLHWMVLLYLYFNTIKLPFCCECDKCFNYSLCSLLICYREACSYNLKARVKGFFFAFLGLLLPVVLLINFLASSSARGTLNGLVGKEVAEKLHMYTVSTTASKPSVCFVLLWRFQLSYLRNIEEGIYFLTMRSGKEHKSIFWDLKALSTRFQLVLYPTKNWQLVVMRWSRLM